LPNLRPVLFSKTGILPPKLTRFAEDLRRRNALEASAGVHPENGPADRFDAHASQRT
jgi:hypothetical protein